MNRPIWLRALLTGGLCTTILVAISGCAAGPPDGAGGGGAPTITDVTVTGELTQNQAGALTITATVTGQDGQIAGVAADLRRVGGEASAPLSLDSNGVWTFTGEVIPPVGGTQWIVLTATSTTGTTTVFDTTVDVATAEGNVPPELSDPTASGSLIAGRPSQISVSVIASDSDGTIERVTANLSRVGGPDQTSLTPGTGNVWAFTGTVSPIALGVQTIIFETFDNLGATDVAFASIAVIPPPNGSGGNSDGDGGDGNPIPPVITGAAVDGTLVRNQESTVTLSATALDEDGEVVSVSVDLQRTGGTEAVPLVLGNHGLWTATATLTPPTSGGLTVTFTATDDQLLTGTFNVRVQVASSGGDNGGDNMPPVLTDAIVTSPLLAGQAATVLVSVTATDPDNGVVAVTADLSAIGGSATSQLQLVSGDLWALTAIVVPPTTGTQTVTITATDAGGATASTTASVTVNAAPATVR